METRAFPLDLKQLQPTGEIVGLAAAFGNVDHGGDRILPGAFAKTLAQHRQAGTAPAMLLFHDLKRPCGVWTDLAETSEGLLAKGRFTLDASDGREAYALCRDGAIKGLSIGYAPTDHSRSIDARELKAVNLFEVSLVPVPMNDRAQLQSVKTIAGARDIEDLLRAGGLSNRQAKAAAGAAWRSINQADDDAAAEAAARAVFVQSAARIAALRG